MPQSCCTVCLDDDADVVFCCETKRCPYALCGECITTAFEDSSGENSRKCPMCHAPSASQMVQSVCGKGALRAVERELRSKVEYEVRVENERKEKGRVVMAGYKLKAKNLVLAFSETLNMRCPRCKQVFGDYDGCNALRCGNSTCNASFCAVCLEDCGCDAHAHARTHGNLFDKELFRQAKTRREKTEVQKFLHSQRKESFEMQQLLKIKVEHLLGSPAATTGSYAKFLEAAKLDLAKAVRDDRLAVLSDPDTMNHCNNLDDEKISPRNSIPLDYHLVLQSDSTQSFLCRLILRQLVEKKWTTIALPDDTTGKGHSVNSLTVDSLIGIQRALNNTVIAFEGSNHLYQTTRVRPTIDETILADTVSIGFQRLLRNGDIEKETLSLNQIRCSEVRVLGHNPNQRLLLLEQHVSKSGSDVLLFPSLQNFVGIGTSKRLLNEIDVPAPKQFEELNQEQQRLAHPLSIRSAMECAGPPGTGKTKTITTLMRSLLYCTSFDIIILSERNGAIDAIAEKFACDCLQNPASMKKMKVKDFTLWNSILTFGSASIGPYTQKFTSENKLRIHPEIVELCRLVEEKEQAVKQLKRIMINQLVDLLESLTTILPDGSDVRQQSTLIQGGREPSLERPSDIIHTVQQLAKAIGDEILNGSFLTEEKLGAIVGQHSSILQFIIPAKPKSAKGYPWRSRKLEVIKALRTIRESLLDLLQAASFSVKKADDCQIAVRSAREDHEKGKERVKISLHEGARVMMATIGSSHKLPVHDANEDQDGDLADDFQNLSVAPFDPKRTIVVFDEAGCIPAYELLGLSRLGRSIESLVCVGDKHQLPPFSPNSKSTQGKNKKGFGGRHSAHRGGRQPQDTEIKSLLDVSRCNIDKDSKILLTRQYRVPHDIAKLLDDHIYNGMYQTASSCKAPEKGFRFVNVQKNLRTGTKYVNDREIDKCFELVRRVIEETESESIMILTPYKKQQRQMQLRARRCGYDERISILTIDQCQGQEADYVFVSLVQRPTRFLTKNRVNVALSRVRVKLFWLADEHDFRLAATERKKGDPNSYYWECSCLAQDMLRLGSTQTPMDNEFDGDDFD